MDHDDAIGLLAPAVPRERATWADLGAGTGTFTLGLAALLDPGAIVFALDRDARALARLGARAPDGVRPVRGDFRHLDAVPELQGVVLDGALFANALHFVAEPAPVLAATAARVRDGGRIVILEYDGRPANPWVPHPLPIVRLGKVAAEAGVGEPQVVGERPSAYGGVLYCAVCPVSTSDAA